MIYRVLLDGVDIYDASVGLQIIKGSCDLELNGAGSCEITIPKNHTHYDLPKSMVSEIEVLEGDEVIWFGRVTDISVNWNNEKKITAEGALAYFNDSIIRPYSWTNVNLELFFNEIIGMHNDLVPASKMFTVGVIDPSLQGIKVTRTVNYTKTFDVLQEQCINALGGYIFLRKEFDEEEEVYIQYIDWYKEAPYEGAQNVEFGLNLLDYNSNFVGTELVTAVIPLGDDGNGGRVTITGATTEEPGYSVISDFLQNDDAVDEYGLITEVVEFNDVSSKSILVEQGVNYLKNKQYDHLSFECSVAELKYLDPNTDAFNIGQNVRVYSTPHMLDKVLTISKVSYDISNASKKITIGTPPRQDLTQITSSGGNSSGTVISGGSSGGGGGGGGGGSVVTVNPIILTGDDIATITVNGRVSYLKYDASSKANVSDVYTKSQVDSSLAAKADVSTTYTKTEVDTELALKADQSTTYTKTEVDTELALKADQSTTYTKTEVDTELALKADQSTTYTKTEVDTALSTKANQSTTYTKTEVDTALSAKANQSTTYTKTEVDTALAAKANQSTTYTKTEVDTAVATKSTVTITPSFNTGVKVADYTIDGVAGVIKVDKTGSDVSVTPSILTGTTIGTITVDDVDYEFKFDDSDKADAATTYTKTQVDTALAAKADASTTYTKTEVDTALSSKADSSTTYTKTEVDTALSAKADQSTTYTKTEVDTALNTKANASDVYSKSQVYTKTETNDAIAASAYTLPIASANTLGGIKVGQNLVIDQDGVLSSTGGGSSVSIDPVYDSGIKIADYEISLESDSLYIPNNLIELTQAEYDELPASEKNDPTKMYFVKDYPSGSSGTDIIPNPSGTPTVKLQSLQVGDTIYSVSGGSGSGGGVEIVRFTDANPILNPLGDFISTDSDILGMSVINNYYDSKIPYMTSNTAPSGTASASSVADSRYNEPFFAMNGIWYTSGGAVGWVPAYGDNNPYIMYTWSSPVKFSKLYLETCNWINTQDVTLTAIVEGLTDEDVWENCLQTKNSLNVEFSYFNRQYSIFENLNGDNYKAIRITFNQAMYVQNTLTAVIRCLCVY